jgi:ankyrin repeat protein
MATSGVYKTAVLHVFLIMSAYQKLSDCTATVAPKLFQAVEQNDFSKLMELILSSHCDPRDILNDRNETLLHVACRLGHFDIVRILIEVYDCSLSKCDNNGFSPPDYACLYGHLRLIMYFDSCDIKHICCSGKIPPIRLACAVSQFGSVVLQLKPILFTDAYYIICKHLGVEPFKEHRAHSVHVPIHVYRNACRMGDLKMARLALDELSNGIFISVNIIPRLREFSLLRSETCRLGHNDIVSFLINTKGQSILGLSGGYMLDSHHYHTQETKIEYFRSHIGIAKAKRAENHFIFKLCPEVSLIHSIMLCGNFDAVKQLLFDSHYNDHSLIDRNGNTLLHSACVSGRLDIIQFLVEDMNYDINNCKNKVGNCPLHVAIEWGSTDIAEYLLKKGCINNQANELGQTPLYVSILHERNGIFTSLLSMNVDVNITTIDTQESALHVACCCDSADMAVRLLECDKQSCHNSMDAYGDTPLFNACRVENVDLELIGLMIEKGCNPRIVNAATKETPIHIACRRGRIDIMKILLDGDQGPVNQCNYVEMSLLHLACYNDDKEMVEFLLCNNNIICELNSLDILGFAPLHIAATRNMIDIANFLLNSPYHSDINIADRDGNVPLHHLCKREVVARDLIQRLTSDATIVHQNKKGYNPLHFISENSYSTLTIQCILNHPELTLESKKIAVFAADVDGNTPLHVACLSGKSTPVKVLLDFFSSIDSEYITSALLGKNSSGDTPLHLACTEDQVHIIKCILGSNMLSEECVFKAVTQQNEAGLSILHLSCKKDNTDVLKCILLHLKDVNVVKSSMIKLSETGGMSPLHLACKRNIESDSVDIITCILDFLDCNYQDVTRSIFNVLSNEGDSLLHVASKNMSQSICKLLVRRQLCNVKHQNTSGDTALHNVCRYDRHSYSDDTTQFTLLQLLCEANSDAHCQNSCGESPVSLVVRSLSMHGNYSLLEEMVTKKYCNWNDFIEKRECHEAKKEYAYVYLQNSSYCYVEVSCDIQLPLLHSIVDSRRVNGSNSHIEKLAVEALANAQVSPNALDSFGNTPLHIYASIGRYCAPSGNNIDVIDYILHHSDSDVNIQNQDGNTPLHIACLLNKEGIARQLMQSEKANKSLDCRNNKDHLPIHYASTMEMLNCLIAHGANIDDIPDSNIVKETYNKLKSEYPLDPPITTLVIGNSSAGKTTLIKSLKCNLEMIRLDTMDNEYKPTAGMVRYEVDSEEFGKVIFHDFAGQPEYESSHSALLFDILSSSTDAERLPVLFFLLIDVTDSKMIKHLQYWLSFIQNCPLTITQAHVVVVGSHIDCVSSSDAPLKAKRIKAEIEAHVKCNSMKIYLIDTPTMVDCRNLDGSKSQQLISLFKKSKEELEKCTEIDHRCCALYAFLLQTFRESPVKLSDIVSTLKNQRTYNGIELPSTEGILLRLLETLHSRRYILLFKQGLQDPSEYWIMTARAQKALYTEVTGVLFAPESVTVEKRITIESNVGIVPSAALIETFERVNFELLQQFLIYNEFCQKVEDRTTLRLIEGGLNSESTESPSADRSNEGELETQSKSTTNPLSYLFIPGLVKAEKPENIMKGSNLYGYTSGWCLECPKGCYFTIQFLQVLLLRCTFSFAVKHQQGTFLHRKCVIWKNGIFWGTPDGVEVLVEIVEQNTIVIVLVRCLKNHEMSAVKLRADVIHEIHAVEAKCCPQLGVEEYMINPSSLVRFEESQLLPMLYQDKISVTEIANCISNGHLCVQDVNFRPLHINNNLLHFEPYAVIGKNPKLLDCLFDPDHASKEVSKEIIYEYADLAHNAGATPHQIGCIMSISRSDIEEIQTSEREKIFRLFCSSITSYSSLRELFDSYSIFQGRNPLVS